MEVNLNVIIGGGERIEGFGPQTIKTKVSLEEAIPAAKDIFHSWIEKILRTGLVTIEE